MKFSKNNQMGMTQMTGLVMAVACSLYPI